MLKTLISKVFHGILGDKRYYQFARFLWHDSRGDRANNMTSNGEMLLLQKLLRLSGSIDIPASLVLMDIGCNKGEYAEGILNSASQLKRPDLLRLICFEPNPACVEKIQNRLMSHPMRDCAVIISKIVTNREGEAVFFIMGETAGTSSLKIDPNAQKAQKEIRAQCVTLDGFCSREGIEEIFFVKVDTEGNDLNVIQGAIEMLKIGRVKYIQFEYNHRWITFRNYLKDVFEIIMPLGYRLAKVTGGGLLVYQRWHYELETFVEGNYLIAKDFSEIGLPLLTDHSGYYRSKKSSSAF